MDKIIEIQPSDNLMKDLLAFVKAIKQYQDKTATIMYPFVQARYNVGYGNKLFVKKTNTLFECSCTSSKFLKLTIKDLTLSGATDVHRYYFSVSHFISNTFFIQFIGRALIKKDYNIFILPLVKEYGNCRKYEFDLPVPNINSYKNIITVLLLAYQENRNHIHSLLLENMKTYFQKLKGNITTSQKCYSFQEIYQICKDKRDLPFNPCEIQID